MTNPPMRTKSRNIRIARNIWGNINAYCRNRKIKSFGEDSFGAKLWITFLESKGHRVNASGLW
jgi:hypothetical protein